MSPDEDSGSELEVRVVPRDEPNIKVGPLTVAMQEKLDVAEDPNEHPRFAGDVGESKSGTLELVLWRDTLPCNIFDVEPARVLDSFPKPLINEFLTHVRVVFKTGFCQFAPVSWSRPRDDVFCFPEAMFIEVAKHDRGVWGAGKGDIG